MHRRLRAAAGALAVLAVTGCGGGGGGDLEAFCDAATDRARYDDVFDGLDPADTGAARATFAEALQAERALRDDAPDAVRSDLDVLVRFFDDLVTGLEEVEPGSDERPAVYDEVRPRFDQVEAASDRVRTYVSANC